MTRNPAAAQLDLNSLLPLDAAPKAVIDEPMRIRSQAHLEQILATPAQPAQRPVAALRNRVPNGSRAVRWVAIPVAAAGALAASIMLPGGAGVPPAQASFATWQAVPGVMADSAATAADEACRAVAASARSDRTQVFPVEPALENAPILTEVRGDWGTLAYIGSQTEPQLPPGQEYFATCLVGFDSDGVPHVATFDLAAGVAGLGSYFNQDVLGQGFSQGQNSGTHAFDRELASTDVQFVVTRQAVPMDGDGFSVVVGRVGADVAGVQLHTFTSGEVEATITDGWFVAWWPGGFGGSPCVGQTETETGKVREWGCDPATAITATLVDGTTTTVPLDVPGMRWPSDGVISVAANN